MTEATAADTVVSRAMPLRLLQGLVERESTFLVVILGALVLGFTLLTPSGTFLGTQQQGALGTIEGGPVSRDNHIWWQISYDNDPSGWSVDYLQKVAGSCGIIATYGFFTPGQSIKSCNGEYLLIFQTDGNVVLYKVENGKRTDLPLVGKGRTYGMKEKVPSGAWGTLRVVANGDLFEVYHNDKKLYEVKDETFKEAGKVGLWTKADSVIYFDDLQVTAK